MASVTFTAAVGGDGSTVTDDGNVSTGLANGGHRVRFVPALGQVVAVAQNTVNKAAAANASAGAAAASEQAAADHETAAGASAAAAAQSETAAETAAGQAIAAKNDAAALLQASAPFTFRNRIINGDMRIDQRNAGAIIAAPADGQFIADRWMFEATQAAKFSAQQSPTAPSGFANSLLLTSSSAYAVGGADIFCIDQRIEGHNIVDLAWGTPAAVPVTLSFWVRSSLIGTFGGCLRNSGNTRSYPFAYTISVANTWEHKSIVVPGDTSGDWLTNNGIGIRVILGLGSGATYAAAAGAWANGNYYSAIGAVSVAGTIGATFYLTGVQLEAGSVATPFELRPYGLELSLCQRYYQVHGVGANGLLAAGYQSAGNSIAVNYAIPPMRASPTATKYGTWNVVNCTQPAVGAGPSFVWASASVIATESAAFYTSAGMGITLSAEL